MSVLFVKAASINDYSTSYSNQFCSFRAREKGTHTVVLVYSAPSQLRSLTSGQSQGQVSAVAIRLASWFSIITIHIMENGRGLENRDPNQNGGPPNATCIMRCV